MTSNTNTPMIGSPAVSIVVPTFNHAQFLHQALASVIAQTFQNWEAIIVNNFSTDDTINIVESFGEKRFRLINFHNNGVIAASRNEGIRLSNGSVIAFLDSDDLWYPNKLEHCMPAFDAHADVVCHGEYWVSDGMQQRQILYGPQKNAQYSKLLYRGNCVSTSATLVRKDLLIEVGGFSVDLEYITAEDYDLWLKLAHRKSSFTFISEVLGEFRQHQLGASSSVERHLRSELAVITSHHKTNRTSIGNAIRFRRRSAKVFYSAGRTHMRGANSHQAIRFLLRAIAVFPFYSRPYVAMLMVVSRSVSKRIARSS
jgi:glycosyltransferase involved in cell wall biosynthesis